MTKINPYYAAAITLFQFRNASVVLADGSELERAERVLVFVPTHRAPGADATEFERAQVSYGPDREPVFAERMSVIGEPVSAEPTSTVPLWLAQDTFGEADVQADGLLHRALRSASRDHALLKGYEVDEALNASVGDASPFGKVRTVTVSAPRVGYVTRGDGKLTLSTAASVTVLVRDDAAIKALPVADTHRAMCSRISGGEFVPTHLLEFDYGVLVLNASESAMNFSAGRIGLFCTDEPTQAEGVTWEPLSVLEQMQLTWLAEGTIRDSLLHEIAVAETDEQRAEVQSILDQLDAAEAQG